MKFTLKITGSSTTELALLTTSLASLSQLIGDTPFVEPKLVEIDEDDTVIRDVIERGVAEAVETQEAVEKVIAAAGAGAGIEAPADTTTAGTVEEAPENDNTLAPETTETPETGGAVVVSGLADMDGKPTTKSAQLTDGSRVSTGDEVLYNDEVVVIETTWRGKALVVNENGVQIVVLTADLLPHVNNDTPPETGPETGPEEGGDDAVVVDMAAVRAIYIQCTELVSPDRAIKIMSEVAGRKLLSDFTDQELTAAYALLAHEVEPFLKDPA